MRSFLPLSIGLGFALACGDPASLLQEAAPGPILDRVASEAPVTTGEVTPAATPAPTASHRLLGIVDPERDGMVAFALKVPVGWATKQSFTRQWDGAVPLMQVTLELRSPDGRSEITWRPIRSHIWSEGPMTSQLRAQKQSFGMDPRMAENELAPMSGSAYAQEVMVPRLAQEGLVLSDLRNAQDAPDEQVAAGQINRRGSVDGTLPDGRKVRVESRVQVHTRQIQGDTYTSWSVVPSITIADDLEAAYAHTKLGQDSIIPNPEWQRLEAEVQARGAQANSDASRRQHEATMATIQRNTDAMTAGHNARMDAIRQAGEASTARYNERMSAMDADHAAWQQRSASQDQQHAYTIDTIRGEQRYADPTTGERFTVEDGSHHVYRDTTGANVILATDAPLDPQRVDWQELKRLQQSEY